MGLLVHGLVLRNVLAALILLARLGDVGSTYLATPNLKMEANPLMRFGGWKLAVLTIAICLIPYYSPELGFTVLIASLLVTASNLSKGWLMRSLGEADYQRMLVAAAGRSSLPVALAFTLGGAASVGLAGLILAWVSGGAGTWAYWASQGVLLYALAIALYGSLSTIRLFRRRPADPGEEAEPLRQ